tara:strand:- start:2016 stop:3200 length:1185 start_codon:yes stop_codon:yes gene_type:complete
MPISNFPNGFAAGLSVRGMPLLQMQTGQVFYVGNAPSTLVGQRQASNSNRGTFLDPFSTLHYAVNTVCVPGRGDIVFVLPGHAESIANATTLLLQCSGVAIIGLGAGSARPTFTFTTATSANIPVAGANMSIQNCLFRANFLSIASTFTGLSSTFTGVIDSSGVITISALTGTIYPGVAITGTGVALNTMITRQITGATGAAGTYKTNATAAVSSATMISNFKDFAIDNCEFRDLSSTLSFLTVFTFSSTANAGDGFNFTNNKVFGLGTVSPTCALITAVSEDRVNILDNVVISPTTAVTEGPALLATGAGDMTNVQIGRNKVRRPGVSTTLPNAISTSATAWTGNAFENYVGTGASGATGTWISAGTTLGFAQNFSVITRAADKSGNLNPIGA